MGAQNLAALLALTRQIERVVFLARGVIFGDVQGGEVVPVVFDLRPFGNAKAHFAQDGDDFFDGLTDGVNEAFALGTCRQGHIDLFRQQLGVERRVRH